MPVIFLVRKKIVLIIHHNPLKQEILLDRITNLLKGTKIFPAKIILNFILNQSKVNLWRIMRIFTKYPFLSEGIRNSLEKNHKMTLLPDKYWVFGEEQ